MTDAIKFLEIYFLSEEGRFVDNFDAAGNKRSFGPATGRCARVDTRHLFQLSTVRRLHILLSMFFSTRETSNELLAWSTVAEIGAGRKEERTRCCSITADF